MISYKCQQIEENVHSMYHNGKLGNDIMLETLLGHNLYELWKNLKKILFIFSCDEQLK